MKKKGRSNNTNSEKPKNSDQAMKNLQAQPPFERSHYDLITNGEQQILNNLAEGESIESFLDRKKFRLRNRIFKK